MIQIPVFQDISADFVQDIELENQVVNIRLTFNSRSEYFSMTFTDGNGNLIRDIKVVGNWTLLNNFKGFTDLKGDLIVLPEEAQTDDITYDTLGNGWNLYYLDEDEVEQWRIDNGLR